ncbi:MAG: hypothetical protein ACE5K7_06625 [Phycisphaerae bacterium]
MRARIALAGALLLCASGCGRILVGQWKGVEVAGGDKTKFSFGTAEFNEDGTFKAIATIDRKRQNLAGTYTFDGFRLKLLTNQGEQVYPALYNVFERSLTLKHQGVKAKVERVGKT